MNRWALYERSAVIIYEHWLQICEAPGCWRFLHSAPARRLCGRTAHLKILPHIFGLWLGRLLSFIEAVSSYLYLYVSGCWNVHLLPSWSSRLLQEDFPVLQCYCRQTLIKAVSWCVKCVSGAVCLYHLQRVHQAARLCRIKPYDRHFVSAV